jgi:3-hydroxyacyl-[acyl-carrier-protein] dehydratase
MPATEQTWRVPTDHPAFEGHFPGNPIVPGVVLLDQAVLFAQMLGSNSDGNWHVSQVKFLSPCGPGDELVFAFHDGVRGGLAFEVRCAGREVASGSLQHVRR